MRLLYAVLWVVSPSTVRWNLCWTVKAVSRKALRDAGCTDEEMAHMTFLESGGTCVRCKSPLFPSLIPDYKYQCFTCDEDFYGFEQENGMDGGAS